MGRPRIHDERTREALLRAAGRVLAEEGAGAVSLRRLADEVGASTQAIYTVFGSKHGLIQAMHRAGFENLDTHLADVAPDPDPTTHLRGLVLAYRASAASQPHLYEVMFGCPFPEFEPDEHDQRLALGTLARLRTILDGHARSGALAGHDPEVLTLQIWALAHGLASLERSGALGEPAEAEAIWRSTVDTFLRGLALAA
ncbi:TetR/AcrR family transcriptional regulator [Nitriliruptor alkaliphilus]|uniref:TetR/AcrR family transcriptional regulator n=1 Tax=Nitriliruptor alkaliphilus TaxID=427918 RepID=UPI0006975674|nr:TetR/AcrR family transcriptional regulator [Nitriliruptor alkaliphilus]